MGAIAMQEPALAVTAHRSFSHMEATDSLLEVVPKAANKPFCLAEPMLGSGSPSPMRISAPELLPDFLGQEAMANSKAGSPVLEPGMEASGPAVVPGSWTSLLGIADDLPSGASPAREPRDPIAQICSALIDAVCEAESGTVLPPSGMTPEEAQQPNAAAGQRLVSAAFGEQSLLPHPQPSQPSMSAALWPHLVSAGDGGRQSQPPQPSAMAPLLPSAGVPASRDPRLMALHGIAPGPSAGPSLGPAAAPEGISVFPREAPAEPRPHLLQLQAMLEAEVANPSILSGARMFESDQTSLHVQAAAAAIAARPGERGGAGQFPWPYYFISTRDCFTHHLVPIARKVLQPWGCALDN